MFWSHLVKSEKKWEKLWNWQSYARLYGLTVLWDTLYLLIRAAPSWYVYNGINHRVMMIVMTKYATINISYDKYQLLITPYRRTQQILMCDILLWHKEYNHPETHNICEFLRNCLTRVAIYALRGWSRTCVSDVLTSNDNNGIVITSYLS